MSLRDRCAHRSWQSVTPVPLAPLPKGGCHGEAVTGGFHAGTSCHTSVGADAYIGPPQALLATHSVGAGFYPARQPRRHFLYPSVGATLAVARPTDFLQTVRRGRWSCCGAQNFRAALRRTLEILTAATRSPRCICHRQRSVRSPHRPAHGTPCSVSLRGRFSNRSWQSVLLHKAFSHSSSPTASSM